MDQAPIVQIVEKEPVKVVVRGLILDGNDRILLARRVKGVSSGQWALLGGKPDDGEDAETALRREVWEESGLTINDPKLFHTVDTSEWSTGDEIWHAEYYAGRAEGEVRLKLDEHSEYGFFTLSELDHLDIAFDHRDVIHRYFEREVRDED